jgi:hypothetical protein
MATIPFRRRAQPVSRGIGLLAARRASRALRRNILFLLRLPAARHSHWARDRRRCHPHIRVRSNATARRHHWRPHHRTRARTASRRLHRVRSHTAAPGWPHWPPHHRVRSHTAPRLHWTPPHIGLRRCRCRRHGVRPTPPPAAGIIGPPDILGCGAAGAGIIGCDPALPPDAGAIWADIILGCGAAGAGAIGYDPMLPPEAGCMGDDIGCGAAGAGCIGPGRAPPDAGIIGDDPAPPPDAGSIATGRDRRRGSYPCYAFLIRLRYRRMNSARPSGSTGNCAR